MSTEIERRGKSPPHIVETFNQPGGDFCMEELDGTAARGAIAVPPPSAAIEQRDWLDRAHLGAN